MADEQPALDDLIRLLDLERIDTDRYRGVSPESRWQRVFGGQVAGQALIAAGRTVDADRPVHSLHAYFIRPGDPSVPITYDVDRVRDGRSFSVRRVVAEQHGKAIFTLSASFQLWQEGIEHESPMPPAPDPASLPTMRDRIEAEPQTPPQVVDRPEPIDVRYVDPPSWEQRAVGPRDTVTRVWMRANGVLPDDPLLHVCVLTYASDMMLLDAVLVRQGIAVVPDRLTMASLDHAMWFRRPVHADDWFLYVVQSPAAAGSRGLATGRFFDRAGHHLVSVVQEGMIRLPG